MSKLCNLNVSELINNYDDKYVESISLKNVKNSKELKELVTELEKADYVVTSFYETMYNDYVMMINSDNPSSHGPELDTLLKYKSLASRIQKAYRYIMYVFLFENPFKVSHRR